MPHQSGKLTPNLDERSTKVLNLTVLQRVDPFVEEILITAAHVTFYEFNVDSNLWGRKDVEGSLFVVKRNTQPRFQFIVMNRRNTVTDKAVGSYIHVCVFRNLMIDQCDLDMHKQYELNIPCVTDNLVENLMEDFEYEVQLPYLLYRNASQEVNGIWFYNARECEAVANLFSRILNAYSKVPTKTKISPTKSEFEELEAVPSVSVIDGPLEPSLSTNTNNTDVQDDLSFINFFNTAMNIGGAPNAAISIQPYNSTATVVSTSSPPGIACPTLPTVQMPSNRSASRSIMSIIETSEPNAKHSTDLVTPSFFSRAPILPPLIVPPIPLSMLTASQSNTPVNTQRTHGAPLLQPFPPPTPPPSLTPTSLPTPIYELPVMSREKVREALQLLIQDNQFIDMVYRAVTNAHQP